MSRLENAGIARLMNFKLSIAFHLIGVVFWLGGLILVPRFLKVFAGAPGADGGVALAPARALVKRMWLGYVIPGLLIAVVTGLIQLVTGGIGVYMQQGWFHTKLTFVLVLVGVTVVEWLEVERVSSGLPSRPAVLGATHGVAAASLFAIVILTILGR